MSELNDRQKTAIEGSNDKDDARRIIRYEEWFSEAKSSRNRQAGLWRLDERLFYQDFALRNEPQTQLHIHLPLAVIRTEMGIISDYMVSADVIENDPDDKFFADMLQHRKINIDKTSKLMYRELGLVEKSLKYGNGIMLLSPKFDADGNFVGINPQVMDPFTWFPDLSSPSIDIREARYQIFAIPMATVHVKRYIRQIEAYYGKPFGWDLVPEGTMSEYRAFQETSAGEGEQRGDHNLLKMCFCMEEDDDESRFPQGRYTVWVGSHLLYSIPVTCQHVFNLKNYGDENKLFGLSQSRLIMQLNVVLNEVMSSIADNVKKTGNPPTEISETLWARMRQSLASVFGVVPVKANEHIEFKTISGTTSGHLAAVGEIKALVDLVTGIHDVIYGKRPTGITAAAAIRELQEAAIVAVRLKLKQNIGPLVEDIARAEINIIKDYDKDIRKIRMQAGSKVRWVDYDPINRYAPNDVGEMVAVPEDREGGKTLTEANLEVEVVAAPALPAGRISTETRATELVEKRLMTPGQWVDYSLTENKEEYRRELEEYLQIQPTLQEVEAQNRMQQQLDSLIMRITKLEPNTTDYALLEDEIIKIFNTFPKLLKSLEFTKLPGLTRQRVLATFDPGDSVQEGANEPAGTATGPAAVK